MLVRFVLGVAMALLATAAPHLIAIPFGIEPLSLAVGLAALALGLILERFATLFERCATSIGRSATSIDRGAVFGTAVVCALAAGVVSVLGRSVSPWLAANWDLPDVALGTSVVLAPWPVAIVAGLLLVPLGFVFSRTLRALDFGVPGVAVFAGLGTGILLFPSFVLRTLGVAGAVALAGVLVIVAATLHLPSERSSSVSRPRVARESILGAIATGILAGVLVHPLDLGGGGTGASAIFLPLLLIAGGGLASLVRTIAFGAGRRRKLLASPAAFAPFAPVAPVAFCALPIIAACIVRSWPEPGAIELASHAVAGGSSGVSPTLGTLAPLPLLAIALAFTAGIGRAFESTRGIGITVFAALITSLAPHDRASVAIACVAASVLASVISPIGVVTAARGAGRDDLERASESAAAAPRRSLAVAVCATAGCLLAAFLIVGDVDLAPPRGGAAFVRVERVERVEQVERDGSVFEAVAGVDESHTSELVESSARVDGLPIPVAPVLAAAVRRLVFHLLVWGDEPQRALVIGPGGTEWVRRLLELSPAEVDYVTPLAGEARLLDAMTGLDRRRLRAIVVAPRRFLEASGTLYDRILIAPPTTPWRTAGIEFTAEFGERIVTRLTADGIAAQTLSLGAMQPANFVHRWLADAVIARPDAVAIIDHPRSADPQLGLFFARRTIRLDAKRFVERITELERRSPGWDAEGLDARGALVCAFGECAVFGLESHVVVPNRDDRPWLASSLNARVVPAPEYAWMNLGAIVPSHSFIGKRIDGPEPGREAFLDVARRDHESVHHWFVARTAERIPIAADAAAVPRSAAESDVLERSFLKSPDLSLLRNPLSARVDALDAAGERARARVLIDRLAGAEMARRDKFPAESYGADARVLEAKRATLLARWLHRTDALVALAKLVDDPNKGPRARLEMGCVLALAGAEQRSRACELLDSALSTSSIEVDARARGECFRSYLRGDRIAVAESVGCIASDLAAGRYLREWASRH